MGTSMGTEVTDEDLSNILTLCDRVIELTEYRAALAEYLRVRMNAIAPNLTHGVGELVGARLISQAGSLMSLAKHPSSTVQILGVEKALFRALKTKAATPKYGLIYHASRVLAAKLSLCCRVDALGDQTEPSLGKEYKEYVEKRLSTLEEQGLSSAAKGVERPAAQKYERTTVKSATLAGGSADVVEEPVKKSKKKVEEVEEEEEAPKKKKKKAAEEEEEEAPKKKKKKVVEEEE